MPSRPRVVRRTPISERLQAYLNPLDFLLWLSEELNSNDIEDTLAQWAVPFGFFVNIIFMVARANTKGLDPGDDVFADAYERRGSGWLAWFVGIRLTSGFYRITDPPFTGHFCRSFFDHCMPHKHLLHFLAEATLPSF